MIRPLPLAVFALALLASATSRAQISLTTAVDLALRNSPRILMAEADVEKARAGLSESKDVYIPAVVGGSGLGYSYGFPLGQPTLFNFGAQSLVFSASQRNYVRAARASLEAANKALMEVRQGVIEDTVLTYIAVDHDAARLEALKQQGSYAGRLIEIVQTRLDAGQDTPLSMTGSRLTAAQIRLALLREEDNLANDTEHLAHLIGLPSANVRTVPETVPTVPAPTLAVTPGSQQPLDSPAVLSAYDNARARYQVARGDARYLWHPQLGLGVQYSRFTNFNNYAAYYGPNFSNNLNALGVGIQLTIPFLDMSRRAKARESAADATHAQHEADLARVQFREGRLRLQRSTLELSARVEIADLEQQLASQQLDVLLVQLQDGNPHGPQMTPKDEQTSRIAERDKFLSLVDARFQAQQAQVSLLRQTGFLESWVKSLAQAPAHP